MSVLSCYNVKVSCAIVGFLGGLKPRQGYLGLQGWCCTAPGSSLPVSLPCSDIKTITPTVDLTTAPQDECLTHCAHRLCPGYSALTEIVFSAVRTVQQHNCAADRIFKEEALSITLSCSVKLYAVFVQLSTGRAFLICCLSLQGAYVQFTAIHFISPVLFCFFKNPN